MTVICDTVVINMIPSCVTIDVVGSNNNWLVTAYKLDTKNFKGHFIVFEIHSSKVIVHICTMAGAKGLSLPVSL